MWKSVPHDDTSSMSSSWTAVQPVLTWTADANVIKPGIEDTAASCEGGWSGWTEDIEKEDVVHSIDHVVPMSTPQKLDDGNSLPSRKDEDVAPLTSIVGCCIDTVKSVHGHGAQNSKVPQKGLVSLLLHGYPDEAGEMDDQGHVDSPGIAPTSLRPDILAKSEYRRPFEHLMRYSPERRSWSPGALYNDRDEDDDEPEYDAGSNASQGDAMQQMVAQLTLTTRALSIASSYKSRMEAMTREAEEHGSLDDELRSARYENVKNTSSSLLRRRSHVSDQGTSAVDVTTATADHWDSQMQNPHSDFADEVSALHMMPMVIGSSADFDEAVIHNQAGDPADTKSSSSASTPVPLTTSSVSPPFQHYMNGPAPWDFDPHKSVHHHTQMTSPVRRLPSSSSSASIASSSAGATSTRLQPQPTQRQRGRPRKDTTLPMKGTSRFTTANPICTSCSSSRTKLHCPAHTIHKQARLDSLNASRLDAWMRMKYAESQQKREGKEVKMKAPDSFVKITAADLEKLCICRKNRPTNKESNDIAMDVFVSHMQQTVLMAEKKKALLSSSSTAAADAAKSPSSTRLAHASGSSSAGATSDRKKQKDGKHQKGASDHDDAASGDDDSATTTVQGTRSSNDKTIHYSSGTSGRSTSNKHGTTKKRDGKRKEDRKGESKSKSKSRHRPSRRASSEMELPSDPSDPEDAQENAKDGNDDSDGRAPPRDSRHHDNDRDDCGRKVNSPHAQPRKSAAGLAMHHVKEEEKDAVPVSPHLTSSSLMGRTMGATRATTTPPILVSVDDDKSHMRYRDALDRKAREEVKRLDSLLARKEKARSARDKSVWTAETLALYPIHKGDPSTRREGDHVNHGVIEEDDGDGAGGTAVYMCPLEVIGSRPDHVKHCSQTFKTLKWLQHHIRSSHHMKTDTICERCLVHYVARGADMRYHQHCTPYRISKDM